MPRRSRLFVRPVSIALAASMLICVDAALGQTTTNMGLQMLQGLSPEQRAAISQQLGEVWTLHIDASAWGDEDKSPVGVTEAYLQYRPYPFSGYRLRVKAGAPRRPSAAMPALPRRVRA